MKILIVEDNKNKLIKLKEFIQEKIKINDLQIEEAKSFTSGIRKIKQKDWDLIILDMSLPTYDITHRETGGDKKPVAGKEIMKRMLHRNLLVPVIIVTQFETFGENKLTLDRLNEEFEEEYKEIWRGTVFYEGDKWKGNFEQLLENILLQKEEKK